VTCLEKGLSAADLPPGINDLRTYLSQDTDDIPSCFRVELIDEAWDEEVNSR
jgi:hypothetical protein